MSDKQTNTENAARVASNGEEHRNSAFNVTGKRPGPDTAKYERILTEEEVKRIIRTPAPPFWTKYLRSHI